MQFSAYEEKKSPGSDRALSRDYMSTSALSRNTLERVQRRSGSQRSAAKRGGQKESSQAKTKHDYVFFDLFAMYAKNLIEEKRRTHSAKERSLSRS